MEGSDKEKKHKRDDVIDEDTSIMKKKKKSKRVKEASLLSSITPVGPSSAQPSPTELSEFLVKHSITIITPPSVEKPTPIISFSQLDIPDQLRTAFSGFKEPTPIQACTWPPGLKGHDVVGIAETGR